MARHLMCQLVLLLLWASQSAWAGGFDRFDQDISLLFDSADTVVDGAVSYVWTDRHYVTVNGVAESVTSLENYAGASLRVKKRLSNNVDCLLVFGRPFGSHIDYGDNWSGADRVASQRFDIGEFSSTCSHKLELGSGYLRTVAGVQFDQLSFKQTAFPFGPGTSAPRSVLEFDDVDVAWRAGFAYEIPKMGLVASVLYFAPLEFNFDGKIQRLPTKTGVILPQIPIEGRAVIPQAMEASIRSAISPRWAVGFGIRWMDWSDLEHVPILASARSPIAEGTQLLDLKTYFRDGWSAAVYLGHKIDDEWSLLVRAAWDRATETGWTSHSETWSIQTTVYHKISEALEARLALNAAWLAAGAITKGPTQATWGHDIAIVPQFGLTLRY